MPTEHIADDAVTRIRGEFDLASRPGREQDLPYWCDSSGVLVSGTSLVSVDFNPQDAVPELRGLIVPASTGVL